MSLLLPYTNDKGSKPTLSKNFRVGSQTQLKKVSQTYWRNQLPKKGIKMKGEDGKLDYAKHPAVQARISQLLRKRGYVTEKTLEKDLLKDRVRAMDRIKVINAMRGKFAKKEEGILTSEQILANVKRSRAVGRLMSTRGMSKAQEIQRGRHTENIKEKFKEETYARLNVHGESHAISALGGQMVNPDDARYKEQKSSNTQTSAINRGPIKAVTVGSKDVSSGKEKESSLAPGLGLKKIEKKKEGSEPGSPKTESSGINNVVSLAQTENSLLKKEVNPKNDGEVFRPRGSDRGPVFDSEWQGGVILRKGKKTMHFPDIKKEDNEEDTQYKKAA